MEKQEKKEKMTKQEKVKEKNIKRSEKKPKLPLAFKVGIVFLIISPLRYLFLLCLPWVHYSNGVKLGMGSVVFVIAEILFWIGVFLVGEEVVREYKKYLQYLNIVHHTKKFFKRKK